MKCITKFSKKNYYSTHIDGHFVTIVRNSLWFKTASSKSCLSKPCLRKTILALQLSKLAYCTGKFTSSRSSLRSGHIVGHFSGLDLMSEECGGAILESMMFSWIWSGKCTVLLCFKWVVESKFSPWLRQCIGQYRTFKPYIQPVTTFSSISQSRQLDSCPSHCRSSEVRIIKGHVGMTPRFGTQDSKENENRVHEYGFYFIWG